MQVRLLVPILDALAAAEGLALSAQEIADSIGVSRQSVYTVIYRHLDLGVIEGENEHGRAVNRYYVKTHSDVRSGSGLPVTT